MVPRGVGAPGAASGIAGVFEVEVAVGTSRRRSPVEAVAGGASEEPAVFTIAIAAAVAGSALGIGLSSRPETEPIKGLLVPPASEGGFSGSGSGDVVVRRGFSVFAVVPASGVSVLAGGVVEIVDGWISVGTSAIGLR
jgi:hypothetical protein